MAQPFNRTKGYFFESIAYHDIAINRLTKLQMGKTIY